MTPMSPDQLRSAFEVVGLGFAKLGEHVEEMLKSQPGVGEVHVSTTGKKPKPPAVVEDGDAGSDHRPLPDAELDKAWELDFKVTKADPDQRKVWGWASISQVGAEIVIDKQGDIIPIVELEKGAYDFMLFARDMGVMHEKTGVGKPFESMVFTPEKAALGIVAKNDAGKNIYGWWCGWQIEDDGMWAGYKNGKFPEFSIGGRSSYTEQP